MDQDQKHCAACQEIIMEGALVCPKCRSPQQPQRWGTFFSVLKWIGGFTAIISVIIGVKQISGIGLHYGLLSLKWYYTLKDSPS